MVHASHAIFGAYGFWLPNDPRGSWSDFVGSWELFRFGPATPGPERKSILSPTEWGRLQKAKASLKYPPVVFTDEQIECIGRGFADYAHRGRVTIWACSILPEHVHLVVARHRMTIEQLVRLLKGQATKQLLSDGLHPLAKFADPENGTPTPWGVGKWKVFLDTDEAVENAIKYVQDNPPKEDRPEQTWSFVQPFRGTQTGHGWTTYN